MVCVVPLPLAAGRFQGAPRGGGSRILPPIVHAHSMYWGRRKEGGKIRRPITTCDMPRSTHQGTGRRCSENNPTLSLSSSSSSRTLDIDDDAEVGPAGAGCDVAEALLDLHGDGLS